MSQETIGWLLGGGVAVLIWAIFAIGAHLSRLEEQIRHTNHLLVLLIDKISGRETY